MIVIQLFFCFFCLFYFNDLCSLLCYNFLFFLLIRCFTLLNNRQIDFNPIMNLLIHYIVTYFYFVYFYFWFTFYSTFYSYLNYYVNHYWNHYLNHLNYSIYKFSIYLFFIYYHYSSYQFFFFIIKALFYMDFLSFTFSSIISSLLLFWHSSLILYYL